MPCSPSPPQHTVMDLIFFFRLSVPSDKKAGRVHLVGFNVAKRTQQFCSPQDPFNSATKDRGCVSLLFCRDCLANGDGRHCIGSRSPCPDGMWGSVPGQSAAVTAEEVKPEWAQCPWIDGFTSAVCPRSPLTLDHCRDSPSGFSRIFPLHICSHVFFFSDLHTDHVLKRTSEHKQSGTVTCTCHYQKDSVSFLLGAAAAFPPSLFLLLLQSECLSFTSIDLLSKAALLSSCR